MPKRPLKLIVCAAAGRMGRRLAALAAEDPRFELAACVFNEATAETHGAPGIPPGGFAAALDEADAAVDFSSPEASMEFAAKARKPLVIGTTGFSASDKAKLAALARKNPIFLAPNFSPGVHVLTRLVAEAAKALPRWDVGLLDVHHSAKKDAPSGTAQRLAEAAGRPVSIVSQRLGDVVGEHTVAFAGPCERLELTHRAHSRDVFARGALEACLWIAGRKPGLYGMDDLLS